MPSKWSHSAGLAERGRLGRSAEECSCTWLQRAVPVGLFLAMTFAVQAQTQPFVSLDPTDAKPGYLAMLLINESPFPGERGYVSQENTRATMLEILWVLHSRIHLIPKGYRQTQVAGVSSADIIDVITGTGGRRQCEGFYRDASGRFVAAPRVHDRISYLVKLANSGSKPGRFAELLNYAQGLARAYFKAGIEGADRFSGLTRVGPVLVTGHAYSWMTDIDSYHPGGNFVSIPNANDGSLGGNRFFTLRKDPK